MTDARKNLQDYFLNHLRKQKIPSTIFLINGVKLQGFITFFDSSSVMLQRESHVQLVYKHAISTVMPNTAIQLDESDIPCCADA